MSTRKTSSAFPAALLVTALLSVASCTFYPWWERGTEDQGTSDGDRSDGTVSDPVIYPAAGSYDAAQTISIQCETENAAIYYSLDGSDPTPGADSTIRYLGPLSLDAKTPSLALRAVAVRGGSTPSSVVQADFSLSYDRSASSGTLPELDLVPAGGVFDLTTIQAAQDIEISCDDPLADIYYNLNDYDGLLPTIFEDPTIPAGSNRDDAEHRFNAYYTGFRGTKRYTGPIHVPASTTRNHLYLKAFAIRSGYADSPIAKAHYRKPGFPTVVSCSLSTNKSAVGVPVALDIVYQDDMSTNDGGLDGLRISCRAQGHGTTNEGLDPTMFYIEYARPNSYQPTADEHAFYFYDGTRHPTPLIFGQGSPLTMAHYSIDPSQCTVNINDTNKTLTFHFVFTPLENEYDSTDGWKYGKSFWTWMRDDQTGASSYNNNPVTELVRWELTE